jgi:hypothetical protein
MVQDVLNQRINEIVDDARSQNKVLGLLKFFYYISPLGYLLSYPEHRMTREIFCH